MSAFGKKQMFLAVFTAACLLGVIGFFTFSAPVPHAFQISLQGQTNNPSGVPLALVAVTNQAAQVQFFYLLAEVPTTNGWTTAKGQQCTIRRVEAGVLTL